MYGKITQIGEPLAYILRPESLDDFFGQEEIVGEGKLLRRLIEEDNLHSVIFYGPPGCGKTTLANIVAGVTGGRFIVLSAVTSGVADLRKVVAEAGEMKRLGQKTVLFIDEIHRFNKGQQDALLPHVENGTVVLIGATTENPSFEVNSALLSRSQVFVFKSLDEMALKGVLGRALEKVAERFKVEVELEEEARDLLVRYANGDARGLLNALEMVLKMVPSGKSDGGTGEEGAGVGAISADDIMRVLQRKSLRYDKKGEEHFNIISALHKSMRDSDSDGALYWMGRMLAGGEDPKYIARRLIRFASEDIGMADPNALKVAIAAKEACIFVGMPECGVCLAEAVVYMSVSPKSNALYKAYNDVMADVEKYGNLDVPFHLRNASTGLMKDWGYGKGYKYAHDFKGASVEQEHLPSELKGRKYFVPSDRGVEGRLKRKN